MSDIFSASQSGNLEKVKALLKDKPNLISSRDVEWAGETPLHKAAANGRKLVAEFLLSSNAEVDAKDNDGLTPLHMATASGHLDVVILLLAKGANANAKDNENDTPLHLAAANGHKAIAELLLARKVDVNALNSKGLTPLLMTAPNSGLVSLPREAMKQAALKHGNKEMIELLREHGAFE